MHFFFKFENLNVHKKNVQDSGKFYLISLKNNLGGTNKQISTLYEFSSFKLQKK